MGFWNFLLVGGLITWTSCVFLRAVAARTCQLRAQLVPPVDSADPTKKPSADDIFAVSLGPTTIAEVMAKPQHAARNGNGNGKAPANGKHSGNGNGNGNGKIPLKRPLR